MGMTETIHPKVSAIVVTFRSGFALKECLYALCVEKDIGEIIVVNNGNCPRDFEWLKTFQTPDHCEYKLVSGQGNIGFAAGVNLGVRESTCERLLIINPDAVIRLNSIQQLESARQSGSSPCLVGGKLIYPSGREQRGGGRELLTPWRVFVTYTGLFELERKFPAFRNMHREHDPEPEGPVAMPVVSGAFCYISREDYERLNGFDEGYFLHVEDIDLCRRVGKNGGKVIYTPHATAMHYGSTSKVSAFFVEWNKAKGLARYFTINSTSIWGKMLGRTSICIFAPTLIVRSALIRSYLHTRQAIREMLR